MKIEEDYFYERMRKEVIMKPEDASIKQEGHERHSKGEDIDEASVKVSTCDRRYDMHIHIYTQIISNTHYQINSRTGQEIYDVHITAQECSLKPKCIPQCTQSNCEYLCRHLITCTCTDYVHGHLCKHSHKVRMLKY